MITGPNGSYKYVRNKQINETYQKTSNNLGISHFETHSGDFTSNAFYLLLKISVSGTLEDGSESVSKSEVVRLKGSVKTTPQLYLPNHWQYIMPQHQPFVTLEHHMFIHVHNKHNMFSTFF